VELYMPILQQIFVPIPLRQSGVTNEVCGGGNLFHSSESKHSSTTINCAAENITQLDAGELF